MGHKIEHDTTATGTAHQADLRSEGKDRTDNCDSVNPRHRSRFDSPPRRPAERTAGTWGKSSWL